MQRTGVPEFLPPLLLNICSPRRTVYSLFLLGDLSEEPSPRTFRTSAFPFETFMKARILGFGKVKDSEAGVKDGGQHTLIAPRHTWLFTSGTVTCSKEHSTPLQ